MATVVDDLVANLRLKTDHKSFDVGDKLLKGIHHAIEFFAVEKAAELIGEGIHKLHEWVEEATHVAVHAEKTAQKLGITTDAVQELGYAAKIADISQEDLELGMRKLAINLDEVAQKGKGPAADALKRLGINAAELKGQGLDENLETIAERFKAMPNGIEKTALAVKLFGRGGAQMIPFLNEGKEGIEEFRKEAEELGVVIGKDSIEKFEELEKSQKRLGATWQGLKQSAVEALLPTLVEAADGVREWVKENKEAIKAGIATAMKVVVQVFQTLAEVIGKIVAFIREHWDTLSEIWSFIGLLVKGLVEEFFLLAEAGAAIIEGIIWGVQIVGKIVAGVIFLIVRIVKWFGALGAKILSIGKRIWKFFTKDIPDGIKRAFQAAFDFIANLPVIKQIIDLVKEIRDLGDRKASTPFENAAGANQIGQRHLFGVPIPFTGKSEEEFNQEMEDNINRRRKAGTLGPTSMNIQSAPININIDGSNHNPDELAQVIVGHIEDYRRTELLQAREALS